MNPLEEQVLALARETLGVSTVTRTSTWEELGVDSLEVTEFVMKVEDQLHVQIPDEEAAKLKSVADVIEQTARARPQVGV
jgi:acyl carrier protein